MTRTRALVLLLAFGLAACGSQQDLKQVAGQPLPPTPFARNEPETSAELLEPNTQAVPTRNVELRQRSEEREDDPFDLPPEG